MPLSEDEWKQAYLYYAEAKLALDQLEVALLGKKEEIAQRYCEQITTAVQKCLAEITPFVEK